MGVPGPGGPAEPGGPYNNKTAIRSHSPTFVG